jgi:hypothetical protein
MRDDKRHKEAYQALCGEQEVENGSIYFHHTHGGYGENKSALPIKTVDEVISEAGETVPWVIENVLARGSLTEFSGLAKRGGKTTFWCYAIVAGAKGENHAGFLTEPAKYLYLTEQGNNFAQALQESGLVEHPGYVRIVQFKDVSERQWETLINQAGQEAKNRDFDVLVVDTFAVFARLKGSEENDAGPVANRMRVLRLVAQKHNIAVVLVRHAGKDGTPRGSSAFEAEADICVTISRPEGRHAPNVRRIAGIGRYGEWERNIQLKDGQYISLGEDSKIEFSDAVRFIKAVLPESPGGGLRKQEVLDKRSSTDGDFSASTLDRALVWLVKQGEVGEKQLTNERGKPKVYWRAYNPPGGGEEGEGFISTKPPSRNGENKSKSTSADLTAKEDEAARFPVEQGVSESWVQREVLGGREERRGVEVSSRPVRDEEADVEGLSKVIHEEDED